MFLIPTNMKNVAKLAGSSGRYAMDGVHVEKRPDGGAIVSATNTKVAVEIRTAPRPADEYPLALGDDDATSAIIPAKVWDSVMTDAAKITKHCRGDAEYLKAVAVQFRDRGQYVNFAATNAEHTTRPASPTIQGKFPPLADTFDRYTAGAVVARFSVDPVLLAKLLTVLAAYSPDDEARVDVELHAAPSDAAVGTQYDGKPIATPIILRVANLVDGVEQVRAIVMPLAG